MALYDVADFSDNMLCVAALHKFLRFENIDESPLLLDIIVALYKSQPTLIPLPSFLKLIQGLKMLVVVKRLKQSCSLTELKEELNTYFPDSCPAYDLQEVGQKIKVANMQFLESVNVDEESLKEFLRTFPVSKIQAETLNLSSKLVESLESQLSAKEKQMVKGSNQIPDNVVNHMELVPNLAIHLKP